MAELDRNSNNTFKLLVGNKADLAATPADKVQVPSTQPRVTKEEAEEFARRIDAEYVELS